MRCAPRTVLAVVMVAAAACAAPDEAAVRVDDGADGLAPVLGGRTSQGLIGITDAVLVVPPGGGPAAAYMTIGLAAGVDTLLHAELEDGRRIGLHAQERTGDRVRMSSLGPVPLVHDESLRLHPGEKHIMIESLATFPAPGDSVQLVLHFARAGRVEIDARVIRHDQLDGIFAGVSADSAHRAH